MKVLTRYLLRAHIGPFLFAFLALTGVILINTLARALADLAGKGLPMDVILRFFVLSLPANVALTFPMAVLVAVLYTFSDMSTENEITALKASGVDLRRLVMPLLVVAALITGAMVWFNDRVLPEANHEWRVLMGEVGRKSPLLTLQEQAVNPIPSATGMTRYYLQAGRINSATNSLKDVVIYDVGSPTQARTIYADSGTMALNPTLTDFYLTLYDGHVREMRLDEPQNFQKLSFRKQLLRMPDVGNQLESGASGVGFRGDREMTTRMLQAHIDTLRRDLALARNADGDEGLVAGNRVPSLRRQIREYKVEIHKKFSIASATLVFALIGAPLALRFPRGGIGMVIAASLTIFALYYVGLIGGETLADEGYVAPGWAMWLMNGLLGSVGLVSMLRMGRESSSTRGGGDGLGARIRGLFSRGA